jgi:hypothetical protein
MPTNAGDDLSDFLASRRRRQYLLSIVTAGRTPYLTFNVEGRSSHSGNSEEHHLLGYNAV